MNFCRAEWNVRILTNPSSLNTSLSSNSTPLIDAPATSVDLGTADSCVGKTIQTPGSAINDQLRKALGSGVDSLQIADSINEVVGALAGQLVNQVLGSGGLLGVSQASSGGGRSYLDRATDADQFSAQSVSIADGFIKNVQNMQNNLEDYQDDHQVIIDVANRAKLTCTNSGNTNELAGIQTTINDSNAAILRADQSLAKLDALLKQIDTAVAAPASNRSLAVTTIITQNQNILSSSDMPTAREIAQVRQDTIDTGDSTQQSKYSRYAKLAKSCKR